MEKSEKMETRVGVIASNGILSRIYFMMAATFFGNNEDDNTHIRQGTVTLVSNETREHIELTLCELRQFLQKFEREDFCRINDTTATNPEELKIFLQNNGEFYSLQYGNKTVPFDRDTVFKLLCIEPLLKSYVGFEDIIASDSNSD